MEEAAKKPPERLPTETSSFSPEPVPEERQAMSVSILCEQEFTPDLKWMPAQADRTRHPSATIVMGQRHITPARENHEANRDISSHEDPVWVSESETEVQENQAISDLSCVGTTPQNGQTTADLQSESEHETSLSFAVGFPNRVIEEASLSEEEIPSPAMLLYFCHLLDTMGCLAFLIPIIGQAYFGARLANDFKPLTRGSYSFFTCCSHAENNDVGSSSLNWNHAPSF